MPMKVAFSFISLLSLALVYIPVTRHLLSFTTLSWKLMGITALMTVIYFIVIDTVKVWFYKANLTGSLQS
jgi:hypothetical protein